MWTPEITVRFRPAGQQETFVTFLHRNTESSFNIL